MKKTKLCFILCFISIFFLMFTVTTGCDILPDLADLIGDDQPPSLPLSLSPENGAKDVTTNSTLSWSCSDPEDDPLTYDVYFGTSSKPQKANSNQSETTFDPGTLNNDEKYYWKIVAKDDHGNSTSSIVWSFTTEGGKHFNAPFTTSSPTIDGVINTGEWTDASVYTEEFQAVDDSKHDVTMYLMHDGLFIYVAIDSGFSSGWDVHADVRFDGNHNHILDGDSEEPHIDIQYEKGSPGAWSGYDTYVCLYSSGYSYVTPPLGTAHESSGSINVTYEFKVALEDLTAEPGYIIGFNPAVRGSDPDPLGGYNLVSPWDDMENWADLKLLVGGINVGLVAYYPFNGNADDGSGNGNDGTVYGATLTTDRFGNPSSAYDFDGTDDYIHVPSDGGLSFDASSQSYTISLFFFVDSFNNAIGGDLHIIKDREIGTNSWQSYSILVFAEPYKENIKHLHNGIWKTGYSNTVTSSYTMEAKQWYHVALIVKAGQTQNLYINGQLNNFTSLEGITNTLGNTGGITIGAGYYLYPGPYVPEGLQIFNGIIDEVRIYNRALTEEEIEALYHEGGWGD